MKGRGGGTWGSASDIRLTGEAPVAGSTSHVAVTASTRNAQGKQQGGPANPDLEAEWVPGAAESRPLPHKKHAQWPPSRALSRCLFAPGPLDYCTPTSLQPGIRSSLCRILKQATSGPPTPCRPSDPLASGAPLLPGPPPPWSGRCKTAQLSPSRSSARPQHPATVDRLSRAPPERDSASRSRGAQASA